MHQSSNTCALCIRTCTLIHRLRFPNAAFKVRARRRTKKKIHCCPVSPRGTQSRWNSISLHPQTSATKAVANHSVFRAYTFLLHRPFLYCADHVYNKLFFSNSHTTFQQKKRLLRPFPFLHFLFTHSLVVKIANAQITQCLLFTHLSVLGVGGLAVDT